MSTLSDWELEHDLDHVAKLAIYHTMLKLYRLGINETRLGKLMRIVGIDEPTSRRYDNQIIVFDIELVKYIEMTIGATNDLEFAT